MKIRFNFRSLTVKYAAIIALPMALLLFQPAVHFTTLAFGRQVRLETMPIDPTDFLRGDYVTLDYPIARELPEDIGEKLKLYFDDRDPYEYRRQTVYATLEEGPDGLAVLRDVTLERPPWTELYIICSIANQWWGGGYIDFGLGVYYVPEGTGRELEDAISSRRVVADVRVLRGHAVINRLEVGPEIPPGDDGGEE
jgi:uncharacterized membrane-anchored protein